MKCRNFKKNTRSITPGRAHGEISFFSTGPLALLLLSSLLLSGCGLVGKRVNAYERAVLSKPGMALVENPQEQAGMNHMFNAREGSTGGFGGAGGGCGCN